MTDRYLHNAFLQIGKAEKQYSQRDYLNVMSELSALRTDPYWPSRKELTTYFNKAISPYGYPNYQKICHKAAVTLYSAHFCFNKLNDVNYEADSKFDHLVPSTGDLLIHKISFSKDELTAPVLYITDALAEALFQTKSPADIDFTQRIYNNFLIIFSNQFERIRWVHVYFDGETSKLRFNFTFQYEGIEMIWTQTVALMGQQIDEEVLMLEAKYNCQRIDWFFTSTMLLSKDADTKAWDEVADRADKCKDFAFRLSHDVLGFVCNLILLSQQQPEILTVQDSRSKYVATDSKGFKSTKINKQPQVHWLGENFTTRVVRAAEVEGERQVGTPKRSHWRKGHWHTVLQGPGRKQKQMRWFQPTFIRGNGG